MEYLTVEEIAERWVVPVSTVRRWCGDGTIPALKQGRQWLVDSDELPAHPPRSRRRAVATVGVAAGFDMRLALERLQSVDLKEPWVPDVLNFEDISVGGFVVARASERLASNMFDPPAEVPIPKTPFFTRSAVLLTVEDRISYQAVVQSFADLAEAQTSDSVFSARVNRSNKRYMFALSGTRAWLSWKTAVREYVHARSSDVWMVRTDLTAYFDTIPHELLINEVMALGVPARTVSSLRAMLRSWAIVPGMGIPQGPNASRLLGNLYLLPLDRAMRANGAGYFRYFDDVRIVAESKHAATKAMRTFERECRRRGLLASPSKTDLLSGRAVVDEVDHDLESEIAGSVRAGMSGGYGGPSDIPERQKQLRKIMRAALKNDGHLDVRRAKFSIFRLSSLRDVSVLRLVLANLDNLAPAAQTVVRYLRPFISRSVAITAIAKYLRDDDGAASPFMLTWVLALVLDGPVVSDTAMVFAVRALALDRNRPTYLRVLAVNVLAAAREPGDVAWMRNELAREYDHGMLRGLAVALHRARALDKNSSRALLAKVPDLARTVAYLDGRVTLPSLIARDHARKI